MSTPHPRPEIHISPEVLADAHQLRELLVGVAALLAHPHRVEAVSAARGATFEARATADRLTAQLDALAAMQTESERAEHLHREHAAKQAEVSR